VIVLAPMFGRLAGRVGQRALLVPGGLVYAVSAGWFLAVMTTEPHWVADVLPGQLLGGLGVAMVIPHLTSAAVQGLPADAFGAGSAVNQATRQFGATFGVALTVALLGTVTPLDALDHFQRVWWLLVICGLLTSAAALALPRRAHAEQAVTLTPSPEPIGEAA
jgi:MFS family permease